MRHLLIGGAGYIGSNVAKLLARSARNQILVYDDLSTGTRRAIAKKPNVRFVPGSQLDAKKLARTMKAFKPDAVMHFAAKIIVSESVSKPLEYFENNVGGMVAVLGAMRGSGAKRLVFSSTAAVYGNPRTLPISEGTPPNPINPYGSSKLACEHLIKAAEAAYGIRAVVFRYFNVAGASDDAELGIFNKDTTLLIPRLNMALLNRSRFTVYGSDYPTADGTCVRDFIHVVDLARAHLCAATYLKKASNPTVTINLGTNKGYTVKQCVAALEEIAKAPLDNVVYAPRRPGDPAALLTDNALAKRLLGWEPEKSLRDMIASDLAFRVKRRVF